ncbi:hypothetical protein B0T11DRAFT_25571 [Plectosphaerella cucumerina]|uniref:Zn(2)-C6 fungal-type domain-containing protein n=1 Tax=Plectosphaerella cucumerina TaxID=40658 RepID=A0A8K0XA03_9PEZI|nr:hypothetical protein B0T11DRAFT_25571 [Plectosphaerella cucumerina]
MSKRYRELLPLPNGTSDSSSTPTTSSSSADPERDNVKRKRVGTQLACNECRRRKARCDGKRPACTACVKRSASCSYADKESQGDPATVTASMQVLDMLKSASESQALDILRLLRANGDPEAVMSLIHARNDSVDSAVSPSPSLNPFNDFSFELMSRNPVSYPAWRPPNGAALESSSLLHPFSLRRTRSFDQRTLFTNQAPHFDPVPRSTGTYSSGSSPRKQSEDIAPKGPPSQSSMPNPALCDSRLEDLDVGFWTTIDISADLAGRMISLYLETDHPLLGTFDPDLFVTDLIQKGSRFCNRLLFAAIMYWGCSMYTAVDLAASQYTALFEKEAEDLWAGEKHNDCFLNIAASQLLSLAYLGHGKDHFVLKYVASMNRMGTRLGLLGLPNSDATEKLKWVTDELSGPASYAAWGAFNWIILMSLFYQQPGLEYPDYPPTLPLPGVDRRDESQPQTESDTSLGQSSQPDRAHYMGETFPTLCRFWLIMHGVTTEYYKNVSAGLPPDHHVGLEFAERKYRELLAWAETLPSSLVQSSESPHHVVIFHIWFHAAILDIFRPFVRHHRRKQRRLKTFSSSQSSPDAAYKASVDQLKRLIIIYRSNYTSSAYTMLWHTALIYVANAVLQDKQDPEWRFFFLLCIYGYESLRRSYRLAEAIGRGLLSMTLRNGDLSTREARQILQQLQERGLSGASGDIRATFMVDLDLAMTDPVEAKVESLAHRFEEMALFQEFTNAGGDDDELGMWDGEESEASIPVIE